MSREKVIEVGLLNVVIHPHNPELYLELFRDAKRRKLTGRINRSRAARLGPFEELDIGTNGTIVVGRLYFYSDIDSGKPWLDDSINDAADENKLSGIKSELRKLHPEFKYMRYILNPKTHRIYFEVRNEEGKSFSPATVHKAFSSIFTDQGILEKFNEVTFTVIPETDTLNKIYAIEQLKRLRIELSTPNPDDWDDEFKEIQDMLDRQKAKSLTHELTRKKGTESLEPDDFTKKLARVAAENGKVTGFGRSRGMSVVESTASHPSIKKYTLRIGEAAPIERFKEFVITLLFK